MRQGMIGRFSWWLAHYFDDFSAARAIPDDLNLPTSTSMLHFNSHFGNPMNGEAPLNPRYRFAVIERAALTNKSAYTTVSTKPILHNNGIHEWITHDQMRHGDTNYFGRAQIRYPDTIACSNRYKYDPDGGGSDTGANAYLWFANGNDCQISTTSGEARGRYWVPTGDFDSTYGRSQNTQLGPDKSGTDYYDGLEGKPVAGSVPTDGAGTFTQMASLTGVFAGEVVPRTRNSTYKDSSNTNLGGNGTPVLFEPVKSPSGKPFMCIQTYAGNNTTHPVIIYEGSLNAKGDKDVFTMRLSCQAAQNTSSGDGAGITATAAAYTLKVGFDINGSGVALTEAGYSTATPCITYAFTTTVVGGTAFIKSTSSADNTYTLDDLWTDLDIECDFTNHVFDVYIDGTKVANDTAMGTKVDGSHYSPSELFGWSLNIVNTDNATDRLLSTCIDRVAMYRPLSDQPSGSEMSPVGNMTMNAGVNDSSFLSVTVFDDDNSHAALPAMFTSSSYSDSQLVMWLNPSSTEPQTRPLWRGHIDNINVRQVNKSQTKEITLRATDALTLLNRELITWDIGQESVSNNAIIQTRTSEVVNLNDRLYLGVRKLQPLNQTLGFGRQQGLEETTDQRMQLGSAHPIQIYANEDTNGPNDAEDAWLGSSTAAIQQRSIHAEWVRDLTLSNWFKQKFGRIISPWGMVSYERNNYAGHIENGSSVGPASTTFIIRGIQTAQYGNSGLCQVINDRGGHILDVYDTTTGYAPMWPTGNHHGRPITETSPHESLVATSAAMAGVKTITNVASSLGGALFTSTSHGFSLGDKVMLYNLGSRNGERVATTSAATAAGSSAGYGLDLDTENCFFVTGISTHSFFLAPSHVDGITYDTLSAVATAGGKRIDYVTPGGGASSEVVTFKIAPAGGDITVTLAANQIGRTYSHGSDVLARKISDDFKHLWVLWADMRNDGNADADGSDRTNSWGALYPAADNYQVSLVWADQDLAENLAPRATFTDLKIGEEVDMWEIDGAYEPTSTGTWAAQTGGSADGWESKAGSFLLIDTSPFFNLNTDNNNGHAGTTSGGTKTLGDYMVEIEGYPILLDSYWRHSPATSVNREAGMTTHANEFRFTNELTILEERSTTSGGATHYIDTGDTTLSLENAYYWPTTCFAINGGVEHLGLIRGITNGTGEDAGFTDYYYVWGNKEENTLNGALTANFSTVTLTSATDFPTSGSGSINGYRFEWTGKTGHRLDGVTGQAVTIGHANGSTVSNNQLEQFYLTYIDPNNWDTYDELVAEMKTAWETNAANANIGGLYSGDGLASSVVSGNTSFGAQAAASTTYFPASNGSAMIEGDFVRYGSATLGGSPDTVFAGVPATGSGSIGATHLRDVSPITASIGSEHNIKVKSGGIAANTTGVFDEVSVYSSASSVMPMRVMMQIDGFVESPNVGTYWEHDKVRAVNSLALTAHWLSQSGLHAMSDINNVPITENMTTTQVAYSSAADFDDYGSVMNVAGKTFLQMYSEMGAGSGTGRNNSTISTFSYMIGRDGRFEFRPKYNCGFVFNRDNLTVSNMTVGAGQQVTNVRCYYNSGLAFVDYPAVAAQNRARWSIIDLPNVRSHKEATALAQREYNKSKEASLTLTANIIRHSDNHSLDGKNDLMLYNGRYGYVADVTRRQYGPHTHLWTAAEGGCLFNGMVNALDGNLTHAVPGSHGYGSSEETVGSFVSGRQFDWKNYYYWYGTHSVSNAVQIVHVPHGMPKVSETTGNELRIAVTVTGSGSNAIPEFRVELIDYAFSETKSAGNPAGSMWSSAKPMLATLPGGTPSTSVNCRGNGFYEIAIPANYWAAAGSKRVVVSLNYDYLFDVLKYRSGYTAISSSSRKPAHASATLSLGSYNTRSPFPLGIRQYTEFGGFSKSRSEWYAPRLHVVDDVNFVPGTYVTYTDANLGLSSQAMVIKDITWGINERNSERVVFTLEKDESRSAASVRGSIFPEISKGRNDPRSNPSSGGFQWPDWWWGGGSSKRSPSGPMGSDAPNTKKSDEASSDNRPISQYEGTGFGAGTNARRMGDTAGTIPSKSYGTNQLTNAAYGKATKRMDLGGSLNEGFTVLGAEKPKHQPIASHSIDGVDSITSPSDGSTVITDEGVVLPGVTTDGDKGTHEHKVKVRIPRDVGRGGFVVSATLSTGNTSALTGRLTTTVTCSETGSTDNQTVNIPGGQTNVKTVLFAGKTITHSAGNTLEVKVQRNVGDGTDNLQFSSIRLHTLEVTYPRKSVPSDNRSLSKNMRPYDS